MNIERHSVQLTRREFIVVSALVLSGITNKENINKLMVYLREGLTPDLSILEGTYKEQNFLGDFSEGSMVNSFRLHVRSDDEIKKQVDTTKFFGGKLIRIFIDDLFEQKLGHYQMEILDKVDHAARLVWEYSEESIGLEVVLRDTYHHQHTKGELTSPYIIRPYNPNNLVEVHQAQADLYYDDKLRQYSQERKIKIFTRLRNTPGILAFGIANEAEMPGGVTQYPVEDFTDWMVSEVYFARQHTDLPLLLGERRPWFVDESALEKYTRVINTLHYYLYDPDNPLPRFQEYLKTKRLMVVTEETGLERVSVVGPLYDIILPWMVEDIVKHSVIEIQGRKVLLNPLIGLWHIDPHHDTDNYYCNSSEDINTVHIYSTFDQLVAKMPGCRV